MNEQNTKMTNQTSTTAKVKTLYELKDGSYLIMFDDGAAVKESRDQAKKTFQAIRGGEKTATDQARDLAKWALIDIDTRERQEKFDNENWETCKRIAEEVELFTGDKTLRKCPHCGEVIEWDDSIEETEHETADGETVYTCPHCGEDVNEDDAEPYGLYDYLEDVLDVDYIVNYSGTVQSVRYCVGFGGPNIYIDTEERAVCLYWGGSKASYPLSSDAVNMLDDYADDTFHMQ